MKLSRLLCLVLVLGAADASAQTRVYCEEFGVEGPQFMHLRGCILPSMPSYNQNSTRIANGWFPKYSNGTPNRAASNLCVPTAAAMVSAAITDAGLQLVPGSFMDTNILQAPNWWSRVHAYGDFLQTDPNLGTADSATTMSSRAVDVVNAAGYVRGGDALITNSTVLSAVDAGVALLADVSYFDKTCVNVALLGKTCVYTRSSGHAVAIPGAFSGMSTSYYIQFDPSGPISSRQEGYIRNRSFRPVPREPGSGYDMVPYKNAVYVSTDLSTPYTATPAAPVAGYCATCGRYTIVDWLSGIQTR